MFAKLANMFAKLANMFANLFARCSRGVREMFASCLISVFCILLRLTAVAANRYQTTTTHSNQHLKAATKPAPNIFQKHRKRNLKLNTTTKQLPHKAFQGGKPLPNQHHTNDNNKRNRKAERRYQATTTQRNQKLHTATKQNTTQSNQKLKAAAKPAGHNFQKQRGSDSQHILLFPSYFISLSIL